MKKVKCSECKCMSRWCLPEIVNDHNYNYAISAYNAAQRSLVCLQTAKTKALSNEQYCKYFEEKKEVDRNIDKIYQKEVEQLKKKIEEYEKKRKTMMVTKLYQN